MHEDLEDIITEEKLKPEESRKFMKNCFKNGEVKDTGTALSGILPPISRFTPNDERTRKKESVLTKLRNYFERYFDVS